MGLRFVNVNQLLREDSGGREESSEDKCALSFQSERNPLLEAHSLLTSTETPGKQPICC